MNLDERATLLALNFKSGNASRPKFRKTLAAQVQASFGKALSPEEVEATINRLIADKIITVSDQDEIDYPTSTLQTLAPTTPSATPLFPDQAKTPPKPKDQSPASIEPFTQVLKHLREHPKNRPARNTPLLRHLRTVLGHKVSEAEVEALVEETVRAKQLSIDVNNKVTYHL